MNRTSTSNDDELLASLHDSDAEVRRNTAQELGTLTYSNDRHVISLLEVMHNDCEFMVREMAYWALSSPTNQGILDQHPDWRARLNPPKQKPRIKSNWLTSFLISFMEKTK